jgi:Cellulase (glycosyl hydrolase family 5)
MAQQFSTSGQLTSIVSGYDGVIAVSSNHFVNGHGTTVQLRGANIQQSAFAVTTANCATIGTTGVKDASGGGGGSGSPPNDQNAATSGSGAGTTLTATGPIISFMQAWKFNTMRIGVNEAAWLSYTTYNHSGTAETLDNSGTFINLTYKKQIIEQAALANAGGMYVIITLAATHPGLLFTDAQDVMADQDHSITCWTDIANTFGYPNGTALKRNGGPCDNRAIIFEAFNEPFTNADATAYTGGFTQQNYQVDSPFLHCTGLPVDTVTGTFQAGELWTATNGSGGTVIGPGPYTNTTTGLAASGTVFLHTHTVTGTNTSGGVFTTAVPIPTGTTITGSTSGATCKITATLYSGQGTAGKYGWYVAGNQQILSAIRATGAGNVFLCSGTNFAHTVDNWLTNMAGLDNIAPIGYPLPWTSQIGAHWHPYPMVSNINAVSSIANGGSGYAVNDTVLLLMDETGGPNSGQCYWQAQLKVTGVSGTAISSVSINTYTGGIPGVAGGNSNLYGTPTGGWWAQFNKPSNPVPADIAGAQPGTSGTGATFNVTFADINTGVSPTYWNTTALGIITGGYPLAITETGEHSGTGIVGAPWMAFATNFCDAHGASLVAYAYTPNVGWGSSGGYEGSLQQANHTPWSGYGVFMNNWFVNHVT